jgi:hypothetical protein
VGLVAESYMRKGFLIYEEMRKYFTIYCTRMWIGGHWSLQPIPSEFPFFIFFFISAVYSGCTKYSARTKYSAPAYHLCYKPKKPKFREFLFGKIKKEEFARRFFKKNSVFSPLKLLNKHLSKMTFFL